MALQVGQLAEGLRAAGVPALVGLVARVRPDVLLQVGQLRELALTDLASERRGEGRARYESTPLIPCTMLGMCTASSHSHRRALRTANVTQIVPQKSSIGSADVQSLCIYHALDPRRRLLHSTYSA